MREERAVAGMAGELCPCPSRTVVVVGGNAADVIVSQAQEQDLVILGTQRTRRREKALGTFALSVSERVTCPMLFISRSG